MHTKAKRLTPMISAKISPLVKLGLFVLHLPFSYVVLSPPSNCLHGASTHTMQTDLIPISNLNLNLLSIMLNIHNAPLFLSPSHRSSFLLGWGFVNRYSHLCHSPFVQMLPNAQRALSTCHGGFHPGCYMCLSMHTRGLFMIPHSVDATLQMLIKGHHYCWYYLSLRSSLVLLMAPTSASDRFLSISCVNVGVGPGGTTNLLAYVPLHTTAIVVLDGLSQESCHRGLSGQHCLRQVCTPHDDSKFGYLLFFLLSPNKKQVTDYRSQTTGITQDHLYSGR